MKAHKITAKWYSDPQHSWMRISYKNCEILRIADKISSYSYKSTSGKWIYLEEDCDAPLAIKAAIELAIPLTFLNESHTNGRSHIRLYKPYCRTYCRTVMRGDSDLFSKLDQIEDYIKLHADPSYSIPRPSLEYPWSLDDFYTVLDIAREKLKAGVGGYVLIDKTQSIIHTNMQSKVSEILLQTIPRIS